jgi:hypothetical protein
MGGTINILVVKSEGKIQPTRPTVDERMLLQLILDRMIVYGMDSAPYYRTGGGLLWTRQRIFEDPQKRFFTS